MSNEIENNTLQGLYDDDRTIRVEPCINGEVGISIGNRARIWVFAEDFRDLVNRQTELSLAALPEESKQ